jgi:hypothetical protein
VVLLGASNVTRGISTIVETASRVLGGPLDVWAAFGHGRSYGMASRVLGRELPGIVECGLWPALTRAPTLATAALITDVGNDIVYGASVAEIVAWVQSCVEQLTRLNARIVMTQLPLQTVRTISERRFRFFRSILFPSSRVPLRTAVDRAIELNERLCDLCARHAIAFVEPRPAWYGFDPIHIRMRHWPQAWLEMLRPWCNAEEHVPTRREVAVLLDVSKERNSGRPLDTNGISSVPSARGSLRRSFRLRMMAPERRRFFGFEQRSRQPAGRLADGTVVSLF